MNILYNQIEDTFRGDRELVSVFFSHTYGNIHSFSNDLIPLVSDVLIDRSQMEDDYYKVILHSIFHKIHEMKFTSDVNLMTSRRIIVTNNDCISTVHVLFRDKVHINVYFRSSDYDGALPIDLNFISSIPTKMLEFVKKNKFDESEELIDFLLTKEYSLNLFFGSLHRTN